MLNSSPSDSFSVKLKLSLTNSISILTQQKQKQWRPLKKQTQTHFQKILFSNNQTQKTHFQKLFFSNNQTQQPKRNNEINKCKTHLGFCLDRIAQVLLELLGSDQTGSELLELIGSDQWFSLTLSCSISLVPHRSSPGYCSGRIEPGFCWSWVLLEQQNRVQ